MCTDTRTWVRTVRAFGTKKKEIGMSTGSHPRAPSSANRRRVHARTKASKHGARTHARTHARTACTHALHARTHARRLALSSTPSPCRFDARRRPKRHCALRHTVPCHATLWARSARAHTGAVARAGLRRHAEPGPCTIGTAGGHTDCDPVHYVFKGVYAYVSKYRPFIPYVFFLLLHLSCTWMYTIHTVHVSMRYAYTHMRDSEYTIHHEYTTLYIRLYACLYAVQLYTQGQADR